MGHCLLSQAITSLYTKLRPSTIAIPCIITTDHSVTFSIVANCHQTPAFVSLDHFPTISATLLVTVPTSLTLGRTFGIIFHLFQSPRLQIMMTRPGTVTVAVLHRAVSFIHMYIWAYCMASKIRWL